MVAHPEACRVAERRNAPVSAAPGSCAARQVPQEELQANAQNRRNIESGLGCTRDSVRRARSRFHRKHVEVEPQCSSSSNATNRALLCATSPRKLATANSLRPATPHLPPIANSLTSGDAFNCPPHSSAQLAPQQQGYRVLGALVVFDLTVALFVLSLVCVGETIRAKEDQSGTPQAWRNRGRRPSGSLMDPRGFGSPTRSGRALRPHRLRLSVRRCKTRSPMYS